MNADQVKQATDDLISERDRLTSDAQTNGQPAASTPAAPATTASVPAQAKKTTKAPAGAQSATTPTQTAGADAKP